MERESPSRRKDTVQTSAPDRLYGRVIGNGGQPWSDVVKSDVRTQAREGSSPTVPSSKSRRSPSLRRRWNEAIYVHPPQGGRSGRQPRRCSAKRSERILAGSEHRCRKAPASEVPAASRSRRASRLAATNPSPPWPARGSPTGRLAACVEASRRNGAKLVHSSVSAEGTKSGRGRTRISFAIEGPRRGPKPREGRPEMRWKRRVPVRTRLRSNASKVMPHAVPTRTSTPATETTHRSRLRGKRTPRRQRSWRHDTAADGGNPPKGMNRAAGKRRSRDRLHTDQKWPVWGVGATRESKETQRTPGSAAGCNKPVNPAPAMAQSPVRAGRSAEETGETVRNGEVGTGS